MELRRKVIGVPLEKAATAEDGSYVVKGKFTSDNKDEVGDIITRSATERAVPKYRRWGNIRRMHLPDPVGRVARIGAEDGLDWNEVEIKVIDPKAKFEVENGLLQALSVGILINVEDIDVMENGGWVINDYQLAEISLVDHPANYDAELELNLSMDESLRKQMREQGIVPVLRSIGATPVQKGALMENEPEVTEKDAAIEEVVEQPEAEVPAEVEKVIEAEAEAVEEQPAVEEEQPEPVAVVAEEVPSLGDTLAELFNKLDGSLKAIEKKLDAVVVPAEPAQETAVKGLEVKDSGSDDRVAQLMAEVELLKARVSELSQPTERKGAMPVEDVPDAVEEKPVVEEKKAVSLQDALRKHFENRGR